MNPFLFFIIPAVVIIIIYSLRQRNKNHSGLKKWEESVANNLSEPASLHPLIDPVKCLGCATCIAACPEGKILGLINRKAQLVSPSSCIGHGACKEACPTDAITLVFGTEKRGVEIPLLSQNFETNVAGIYIAGELGGMGLIKNAIAQGTQAVDNISIYVKNKPAATYQLVIVGAGPAGLAAALKAKEKKLKYILLEQDTVGGTLAHYPRGKVVMTQPADLPLVGKFQFREASKEALIKFWSKTVREQKLVIKSKCKVEDIKKTEQGFNIVTTAGCLTTNAVLLTLGRRGTPRKLDVDGEELSKVVYKLIDPEQYKHKNVLVVGGGDSALEAAVAISNQPGTSTVLSYRGDGFSRAKSKNRDAIDDAVSTGRIQLHLESSVKIITTENIILNTVDGEKEYLNEAVIVCAGGILPTPFLKKIGIEVVEKFGTQ